MILDDLFQNHTSSLEEKIDLGPSLGTKRDRGRIVRNWRKTQLGEKDSQDIAEVMKLSDIPTSMRSNRLTMKDIEKERPQGAFRYSVGDNEFMDLAAAQAFAKSTGDRVQPIDPQPQGNQPQNKPQTHRVMDPRGNRPAATFAKQQDAEAYARIVNGHVEPIRESQKKSPNPRIERILKMLRARHPQAENDLEALIYDFRNQQAQDRSDISRLDLENDIEEEDIARLEKMLDVLRQRGQLAEYRAKKKTEEPQDNFTADDIKRLETITDLATLKAQAKQLIKGKPARRMKPEKIAYFYDRVDDLPSRLAVIKMMYDLLLAGEGHKVLGTRHSMDPNVYQRRFGEALAVSRDQDENIILGEAGKDACYNKVRSRYKVWPSAYASGALVQCRKKGAANWGTGGKKK